jgi:prophage maintenance system killer protein
MPTTRTRIWRFKLLFWRTGLLRASSFIDGNKRTALIAMLTFLEINGWRVEASDPELADWILSFSSGATPEAVAEFLASAMRSIE